MSLDINMEDSASPLEYAIKLDSSLLFSVKPAPKRVIHDCKGYTRRCSSRAAETPSVIWLLREEY
jgi:hypothetical protein